MQQWTKHLNLKISSIQLEQYCKPLILAALNFHDSIYYAILALLIFTFLLAELSNTNTLK